MAGYGRTEEEWDDLTSAGLAFLVERARLEKTTTYTELDTTLRRRTGIRGFDFEQDSERAAIGHLLGLIVERNRPTTGLLISALVQYLNTNDAGPGFYALAADLGLLPRRSLGNGEASILGRTTQRAVRLLRHQSSGRLTIA